MFCFCLFSKQSAQLYEASLDASSIHHLDYVEADLDETVSFNLDDIVSANDDFIVPPIAISLAVLFLLLPVFFNRRYAQPSISMPQRPPSI